jgi:predicted NAD-dependent protein-ADP-ribosyltransferase YbiA (DUF1768 family)
MINIHLTIPSPTSLRTTCIMKVNDTIRANTSINHWRYTNRISFIYSYTDIPTQFSHNPRLAEYIRTYSPSPKAVFSEAQRFYREVRPDWRQIQIKVVSPSIVSVVLWYNYELQMDTVLWHKFTQHCSLRRELLTTGDAELIEVGDSAQTDTCWSDSGIRPRPPTRSGVLDPMEEAGMSLAKLSRR